MLVAQSITSQLIRSLRPVVVRLRGHNAGLADQIVRAATSVALNLAEGTRRTGRDQKRVFRIAAGEAQEVKAALQTAHDWGFLDGEVLAASRALADRVGALTYGLAR